LLVYLWVAIGGALGSMLRYGVNLAITARYGEALPWGTIFINITGSFAIGLFAALSHGGGRLSLSPDLRTFVLVGLCGGYTTFSSFSLQTLALIEAGEVPRAIVNVVASVTLCLVAVWLGLATPAGLARLVRG
jgi:fluoride exporter